ncbi:MAG: regulatory protein RecX [Xanthomonadales bacterium]|nr:regulatory protein RecX [Xanthomonadales bacterium]
MSDRSVTVNDLRIYAIRLLARREYAVGELHGRLCTKWRGEEGIRQLADELVDDLVNEGSLSDQRYVAAFVRSKRLRSQGPIKIRAELRQRQLSDALIEQALDQETEVWIDVAAAWLARKHDGELEFEDRARFYRRLVNRGFNHEQAMSALDR